MRHEVTTRRVLYEIPGMQSVPVRDDSFTGADGEPLPMKIYGDRGPIVVMLAGYPDPGFSQRVGCRFMEMEWTISMAQLIAASGMRAITHSNRDPQADADALLTHLGGQKIGVWATSGHGPVALAVMQRATCGVLINPVVEPLSPQALKPLFVVRAGQDETPGLNVALDAFVTRAIATNHPLTLVNYPDAPHAFDLFRDDPETRRILQQGLDFLRAHLV
jgi:acetyl esterase/lipase